MIILFYGFCSCPAVQSGPGGNCSKPLIWGFRTSNLSSFPICILFSHLEKFPLGEVCCLLLLPSVYRSWGWPDPSICSLAQLSCLNILNIRFLPGFWRLREYFGGLVNSSCNLMLSIVSPCSLLSSHGFLANICFCYFQSRGLSLKDATPWF